MVVKATDHYERTESILYKTSELANYIAKIEELAEGQDCDVYWRGQSNHTWPITSSLVRRVQKDDLTDRDLSNKEKAILADAKNWITAETTPDLRTDLEWLAYLQHYWVPTRLIDFTPDAFTAIFFASDSHDEIDGRLFAVLVKKDDPVLEGDTEYKIESTPSDSVRVFKPKPSVSPRLAAQKGVFLLGKLPSTHVVRWVKDDLLGATRPMLKDEVASVMSLPFSFRPLEQKFRGTSRAVHSYTARIHINKPSVRRELRKNGAGRNSLRPDLPVNHAFCYPDVEGMRRYSPIWSDVFPGVTSI